MIKELYIQCYIACLIGNIIHITALYFSRSKDYAKNNDRLPFGKFVSIEKAGIIFNFFGSMGLVYAADEWVDSPYVLGKIKTFFIVVGITGSWAVMQVVSKTKKQFRESVDVKSDIADGKIEKP